MLCKACKNELKCTWSLAESKIEGLSSFSDTLNLAVIKGHLPQVQLDGITGRFRREHKKYFAPRWAPFKHSRIPQLQIIFEVHQMSKKSLILSPDNGF